MKLNVPTTIQVLDSLPAQQEVRRYQWNADLRTYKNDVSADECAATWIVEMFQHDAIVAELQRDHDRVVASLAAENARLRELIHSARQKLVTYQSVYSGDKELRRILSAWDAALTPSKRDATEVRKWSPAIIDGRPGMRESPLSITGYYVTNTDHAAAIARVEAERDSARRECERLAGSLAACGVIARCDDAESFTRLVIGPENEFFTDSNAAVNRLCVKRAELAEKVGKLQRALEDIRDEQRTDEDGIYHRLACVADLVEHADAALKDA